MKKGFIILMFLVCLLLGGTIVYIRINDDRTPPQIELPDKVKEYDAEMTDKDFLVGVTARDETDGDVTESLVVESVHISEDGKNAIITYTAKDSSNNVGKKKITVACETEKAGAGSEESGDEDSSDTESSGTENQNENTSINTGAADTEQGKTEYDLPKENPRITLSSDQVVINKGESINRISYVESITDDKDSQDFLWGSIQIAGDTFDNNTEGTYQQIYYVVDSDGNKSNEETLVITVR